MVGPRLDTTFFEMVIIDSVSNGIHFPSNGKQVSVVGSSFQVSEGPDQQETSENHVTSHLFIRSSKTYSSLHEVNIIGHLKIIKSPKKTF